MNKKRFLLSICLVIFLFAVFITSIFVTRCVKNNIKKFKRKNFIYQNIYNNDSNDTVCNQRFIYVVEESFIKREA